MQIFVIIFTLVALIKTIHCTDFYEITPCDNATNDPLALILVADASIPCQFPANSFLSFSIQYSDSSNQTLLSIPSENLNQKSTYFCIQNPFHLNPSPLHLYLAIHASSPHSTASHLIHTFSTPLHNTQQHWIELHLPPNLTHPLHSPPTLHPIVIQIAFLFLLFISSLHYLTFVVH